VYVQRNIAVRSHYVYASAIWLIARIPFRSKRAFYRYLILTATIKRS